jgi:hypothetical protein
VNFSQIDELTRSDHYYLDSTDECFYLREYTSRGGYAHSETNDLISNLKKTLDRMEKPEYRWKGWAIQKVIADLKTVNWNRPWLHRAALVPIPPSKAKSDPLYDDRMVQILSAIAQQFGGVTREILVQKQSMAAAHVSTERPKPSEIEANYEIDESPVPAGGFTDIGLFDDVLTTGSHFKAAKSILSRRFPGARIIGFFIARRVFAKVEPEPEPESGF